MNDGSPQATKYERLKAKADALLKEGDALIVSGKEADGKRKLRECVRVRMEAKRVRP